MNNEAQQDTEVNYKLVNWSDPHIEIFKAIIAAQPEFEVAKRETWNDYLKRHYADLQSIVNACKNILPKHQLAFSHHCHYSKGANEVTVECMLLHESGQWASSLLNLHLKDNNPQTYGSGITYAKRYTLAALLGIVTEDDDGAAASGVAAETPKRSKKASPEPTVAQPVADKTPSAPAKPATELFPGMTTHQKLLREMQDKLDAEGIEHRKLIDALRAKKQIPDSIGTLEQLNEEILKKCLTNWEIFLGKIKGGK